MLLKLNQISFSYANQPLFQNLSWQVNPGQKIGLLGPNGAGKSTLLRIAAGSLSPEQGSVLCAKGKTLGYLHQSQEFQEQGTLWDALLRSFTEILMMRTELQRFEKHLQHESVNEKQIAQYGLLQEKYERQGGYSLEARVRQLAAELGFSTKDFTRDLSTFSGGERGRVELAKVLLSAPDLLLLDEPTNHLDLQAIESLEQRLQNWDQNSSFVVVSHDRYFLQNVCTDIVELEGGKLVFYPGTYQKYLVLRKERYEKLQIAYERQQEEIAETEDFIRRNIAGQNTKQAQSRRKMLEKLERIAAPQDFYQKAEKVNLRFAAPVHSGGKEVLTLQKIEIGYAQEPALIQSFSYTVYRGAKIGIIGPNGAGKSTLLKAMIGKSAPRKGKIERGYQIEIGYFDQKLGELDEKKTLMEEIAIGKGDWNDERIRTYLGQFRFSGEQSFQSVKSLSGGERNRLTLAKMMLKPYNALALDEPTNHLDFITCEILEEALAAFSGTLLIVSHDRYFLDRVVDTILYVNPNSQQIEEYQGNYTNYKEKSAYSAQKNLKKNDSVNESVSVKENQAATSSHRQLQREAEKQKERLTKKRIQLEEKITKIEKEIQEVQLQAGTIDPKDWQAQNEWIEQEKKMQNQLHESFQEWELICLQLEGIG